MLKTLVTILVEAIGMGTIFLFACVGETLNEKVGNLNLGIPGIMCMGTLGGCYGVMLYTNAAADVNNLSGIGLIVVSVLFSMLFSAFGGLIYTFLTVTMKANQNVTGLALTTFGAGFLRFFAKRVEMTNFVVASKYFKNLFPFSKDLGWFGEIFLSHGVLVYLAILIAILASLLLTKTKVGLRLRAIGENPATADAAGISIVKYKYAFITLGSAISGIGGLYYVMDKTNGTTFAEAPIDSFGWLAVALVIAAMWKPWVAIFGSIIFGGLSILSMVLKLPIEQLKIFDMFPYIITVVILIVASIIGKKETQPPAALGLPYFREER